MTDHRTTIVAEFELYWTWRPSSQAGDDWHVKVIRRGDDWDQSLVFLPQYRWWGRLWLNRFYLRHEFRSNDRYLAKKARWTDDGPA